MVKCYFISALLLFSLAVNGQIKKQSILLGGQIYYYNHKNQIDNLNQKTQNGTFSISIGRVFKENKIVGINFSFSPIRQSNYLYGNDTANFMLNRFDLGLFFREYKKFAKDFYFFSQVDAAFTTANQIENFMISPGEIKVSERGGFISFTPGISYQVFKKMQLEITIPNVLRIKYLVTKLNSSMPQVKNSKQEEFLFYSNISNTSSLGFLGVGFRFIL